jgi:hypothetical protein
MITKERINKIIRFTALGVLAFTVVMISSCKRDDPTEAQILTKQISRSWRIQEVELDGRIITDAFPGLVVTFTKTKEYNVVNPVPPIWSASGTYQITTDNGEKNLVLNGNSIIGITTISNTELVLHMHYDSPGGRRREVSGDYIFTFIPN